MRVSRSRDISRVTGRSTLSRSATCCLRKRIRCSCKVACISARRTKERAIFKSADTLVMPWLEIWWVSSAILPQQRSTCSAGQARTCPIRFSLYRRDKEGVSCSGGGRECNASLDCRLGERTEGEGRWLGSWWPDPVGE